MYAQSIQAKPQPFYPVEPPQEFDDQGKQLGPDAQVWKTYVRETDHVDGEMVDGWNKSTDVILIFAALFSAISTAFVIESYKNLKQDPADVSAQTLLTISQTLAAIANGSQAPSAQPSLQTQADGPPFSASWSAICVNILWFLSLSLSVAVSLISMLAKEWCLEFMSGRTGPPGAQARRRQQRWDGLLKWRMKEVLMVLPSLIHLALLLFAIGLCVFLWDVHFGVAIPVVFVTTFATGAYVACTILPFIDNYCPYGTVLSRLYQQFVGLHSRTMHAADWAQDAVTSKALSWIVEYCETPRSVDIALQSLGGATKELDHDILVQQDVWTLIRHRLGDKDPFGQHDDPSITAYAQALESVSVCRINKAGLDYGSNVKHRKLEVLILGLQSSIDSLCHKIKVGKSCDRVTARTLEDCANIGVQLLKRSKVTPERPQKEQNFETLTFWRTVVDPEQLSNDIASCLERHLKGEVDLGPTVYTALCASFAFLLCFSLPTTTAPHILGFLQAYISDTDNLMNNWERASIGSRAEAQAEQLWKRHSLRDRELFLIIGVLLQVNGAPELEPLHRGESLPQPAYAYLEQVVESIWKFLIATAYSDTQTPNDPIQWASVAFQLLANHSSYNLSTDDFDTIATFVCGNTLYPEPRYRRRPSSPEDKALFIKHMNSHLFGQTNIDWSTLPPQLLQVLVHYLPRARSEWHSVFTPEMYLFMVKRFCWVTTAKEKGWCYEAMTSLPFPKPSPHFVQLVSTIEVVPVLANALYHDDPAIRAFATAQLWVFFNMSLQFADRTSETLTILENALLKYPKLDGDLGKQGLVAEQLETQLESLLVAHYDSLDRELDEFFYDFHEGEIRWLRRGAYLYRVLECMLQQCSSPLPEVAYQHLQEVPDELHGWDSSKYLAGEEPA